MGSLYLSHQSIFPIGAYYKYGSMVIHFRAGLAIVDISLRPYWRSTTHMYRHPRRPHLPILLYICIATSRCRFQKCHMCITATSTAKSCRRNQGSLRRCGIQSVTDYTVSISSLPFRASCTTTPYQALCLPLVILPLLGDQEKIIIIFLVPSESIFSNPGRQPCPASFPTPLFTICYPLLRLSFHVLILK